MKKVGIVVDNWKVSSFKEELNKNEFTDFKVIPFTIDTTSIIINVPDDEVNEIVKICKKCEIDLKRAN